MLFCFDYLMIKYPAAITVRFCGRFVHVRFMQTHVRIIISLTKTTSSIHSTTTYRRRLVSFNMGLLLTHLNFFKVHTRVQQSPISVSNYPPVLEVAKNAIGQSNAGLDT